VALIQNGDWCGIIRALKSKHRGSRQQANVGVYFYRAIDSKAGRPSPFDTGSQMVIPVFAAFA